MNPQSAFEEVQTTLESAGEASLERRLVRSRFLRVSSAAFFGAAASAFLPRYAEAHCVETGNHPCTVYELCGSGNQGCNNDEAACCSDTNNYCSNSCDHNDPTCDSQGATFNCWVTCHQGKRYRCCDCKRGPGNYCMCRFQTGTC